jgi:hypothetical protein
MRWPNRDRSSDGTIGDPAHQSTTSDHNPNSRGLVDAWDLDKDGVDPWAVIRAFEKHPSAHYWIFQRQIADRDSGWNRVPYTGSNPHDKHVHFSIRQAAWAENDARPWGLLTEGDDVTTPDELKGAVVVGIHSALDQMANRSTPTGRQMGDDFAVLIDRQIAPISAKLDVIAGYLTGQGETAAGLVAKLAEIDQEATERAAAEVQRDEALLALLTAHDDGTLTAEEVVSRIRVSLDVQPAQPASDSQ